MSMVVRTNINSMNANRNLSINNSYVAKSIEKLASGFQINRASDDASGLAISEKMQAQITGLDQGTENALDGIGLVQTAEGAMSEIHDILNRIVELSTKSANGTIQDEVDREAIQAEVDVLIDEIDRIAQATNFNGIQLLDGSLQVGEYTIDTTTTEVIPGEYVTESYCTCPCADVTFGDGTDATNRIDYGDLGMAYGLGEEVVGVNFTGLTGADLIGNSMVIEYYAYSDGSSTTISGEFNFTITINFTDDYSKSDIKTDGYGLLLGLDDSIDYEISMYLNPSENAIDAIKSFSIDVTAIGLGFDTIFFETQTNNLSEFYSTLDGNYNNTTNNGYIIDKSFNYTSAFSQVTIIKLVTNEFVCNCDTGCLVEKDTQLPDTTVTRTETEVYNGDGLILHVADQNNPYNKIEVFIDSMRALELGIDPLDVSSQESAGACINIIKNAINYVSKNRGDLGALQNRLERTINNNNNTSENMTSAKSAIKDTDMAKEMMEYTKMSVLTEASQSMLAQSNQAPQQILSLLG